MLAFGQRTGTDFSGSVPKASGDSGGGSASIEARAATLAGSFTSSIVQYIENQFNHVGSIQTHFLDTLKDVTGTVVAGIQDDTSVYLWCDPDSITLTLLAGGVDRHGNLEFTFNSQPPSTRTRTYEVRHANPVDRVAYMMKQYGDYSIVQAQSSVRRSNTWSLTFKGNGLQGFPLTPRTGYDCGVNNYGASAGSDYVVDCNVGITHKPSPTVGQRMQYFWHLYAKPAILTDGFFAGEQFAVPCYGYNTGADGTKLFDMSFEEYNSGHGTYLGPVDSRHLLLGDKIEWSDGDTFGLSYDADQNIVFTLNEDVIHTRDASEEYVSTQGATSQVAFSSHWHLQGTPVYDLSFSALI